MFHSVDRTVEPTSLQITPLGMAVLFLLVFVSRRCQCSLSPIYLTLSELKRREISVHDTPFTSLPRQFTTSSTTTDIAAQHQKSGPKNIVIVLDSMFITVTA